MKKTAINKEVKQKKTETTQNNLIKVLDISGQVVEEIEATESLFNVKVSDNLLAQYVRIYLSNQRQGTQSTKTRSEITGTTKKVYRQKGTGRARHGSAKAPIFVGGGVTHAPKPRDYSLKMNSKQKKLALLGALSNKFKNNDMTFVKGLLSLEKTRDVVDTLSKLELNTNSYLFITPTKDTKKLVLSSRNLQTVDLLPVNILNAYDVMKHKKIIILREGLEDLQNLYKKNETK